MNPTCRLAPRVAPLLLAALAGGCLDPLASDEVVGEELILAADAEVPDLHDAAPDLHVQIVEATGFEVDELVPLRSAFAGGDPVRYWDLGPAPAVAIPIYVLSTEHGDGSWDPAPGHPAIIDSIPGDPGYSPFWQLIRLPVTDAYAGERLVSFAAVQQARERGLIGEPIFTSRYVNCPVVPDGVRLEVSEGGVDVGIAWAYYQGWRVSYLPLPAHPLGRGGEVGTDDVYHLRREGGEPLDEAVRGVDMTGDGDLDDTNHVFSRRRGGAGYYAPLARVTNAVVAADTQAVDTFSDDSRSDVMGLSDLFADGSPRPDRVVALHPTGDLCNCPQELAE